MARRRPKFQKERPPDQHAVGANWRLFIAIPLPPPVRDAVAALTSRLAENDWPVRWVAAESAHLTLHFLGDTPPERAELLRLGLAPPVTRVRAFRLTLAEPGVFPDFRNPRVLWVGLAGESGQLRALAAGIGTALRKLEFEVDPRPLHPHVTLGRVRDAAPANLGAQVERAYRDPAIAELLGGVEIAFDVDEVLLMRSFLERGGTRHEAIASYPLGRPGG